MLRYDGVTVAHVLFDQDDRPIREQSLDEHLRGTAELAAAFAAAFHAESWGRAAGLLHDIGKHKPSKACNACSLKDICLPRMTRHPDVSAYIQAKIEEDDDHAEAAQHALHHLA